MSLKGRISLFLLLLIQVVAVSARKSAYEKHCNLIVHHAKSAAAKYNSGDTKGAENAVLHVNTAFEAAKKLDDSEPQAYLNMAVFLSNTHRYNESLHMFDEVLKRIEDESMKVQVKSARAKAEYAFYSMMRDKTYADGKGDIFEATQYAEKQLTVSPNPGETLHQLATLEIMLCEYEPSRCTSAVKHFKEAAEQTMKRYLKTRVSERLMKKEQRERCEESKLYVGSWKDFPGVLWREVRPGLFIQQLPDEVNIKGKDGLVTFNTPGNCAVFSPSSDNYTDVFSNLYSTKGGMNVWVPKGEKTVSLVQFSSVAFYHWMCEVLPRLVILHAHDGAFSEYRFLIPAGAPSFVNDTFDSLLPQLGIDEDRLLEHKASTAMADGVTVVSWEEQSCPDGSFGCPSLAHPAALQLLHKELSDTLPKSSDDGFPYVLIVGRGSETTMRNFDLETLVERVNNFLGVVVPTDFSIRIFETSSGLVPSLQLFRGAAAVVGVHGGALSNLVACRKGTPVIEIGFETKGARQYEHVAKALGLKYTMVPVNKDAWGRALGAPNVVFDYEKVLVALRGALAEVSLTGSSTNSNKKDEF